MSEDPNTRKMTRREKAFIGWLMTLGLAGWALGVLLLVRGCRG